MPSTSATQLLYFYSPIAIQFASITKPPRVSRYYSASQAYSYIKSLIKRRLPSFTRGLVQKIRISKAMSNLRSEV
ncbi:hypothetical protein VTL71DRAFT_12348 [Oculimacula yallundae]|uniref:Uncharacterized protein n=1 Tax=Oculimacula yallundae TaxID=86028 RepID=A0ABR4CMF0_9HELO